MQIVKELKHDLKRVGQGLALLVATNLSSFATVAMEKKISGYLFS